MKTQTHLTQILRFSIALLGFTVFGLTGQSLAKKIKGAASVILQEQTTVNNLNYTLADIAKLEGEASFVAKIGGIQIGRSPLPGGSLTVTNSLILSKMRRFVDVSQIEFPLKQRTVVRRSALQISGSDIDQAVLFHIQDQYPSENIKPRLLSKNRDIFLPKGELKYEVKLHGKYKKEGGYRTYKVEFFINNKLAKTVMSRIYLKIYKEVYVAKNDIGYNQVIKENDIEKVRLNVDRIPSHYVTDKSDLLGKQSKRPIAAGETLQTRTVEVQPIVKTGDKMSILYETELFRVSTVGVAMKHGRRGETIPVRNLSSKKIVQAKILSSNTVQVN